MKKTWVIGTTILLLFGTVCGTAILLDINHEKKQTAICKAKYGESANEYLQQYVEWSQLPAEDRLETMWGQGKYGGTQIKKRLIEQQPGRFTSDIQDLARGTKPPAILAEVLYGKDWEEKIEQYKRRTIIRSEIAIVSNMSLLTGLIILMGFGGNWAIKKITGKSKDKNTEKDDSVAQNQDNTVTPETSPNNIVSDIITGGDTEQETEDNTVTDHPSDTKKTSIGTKEQSIGYFQDTGLSQAKNRTLELKENLKSQATTLTYPQSNQPSQMESKISTLMSTAPAKSDLSELTQEVSAIRQFAADQQDRVRQLQDGYDWGIIKRFCLRIIRCVDNLDERIDKMMEQDIDSQHLEDVRDELIFSLESSGVEQYHPDINSSYKGLEKHAEAVKGRAHTDDESLVGKIAKVVRPGYQYVVNDNDVKIVRCSQVKLYGKTT